MGTSDVLKVLKIAWATGKCTFRKWKTLSYHISQISQVVHMIFCLWYSQRNKKNSKPNCLTSVHKNPLISMAVFLLHSITSIFTLKVINAFILIILKYQVHNWLVTNFVTNQWDLIFLVGCYYWQTKHTLPLSA